MIQLKGLKKIYTTSSGDTAALDGIDLTLQDKGMVFITGKSGSGKTTLLNVIGGLDGVTDGEIIIDGKSFSNFSAKDFDSYRNTFIGFIFQEYNLLLDFTVDKNIKLANEIQGAQTDETEIQSTLKMVDIEGLQKRMPSELSGGQKQRVAIARALIKKPKVIMADEPTGALDSITGIQVMDTLKKLSKEKLVLIVSHDLELAEKYADRIITIRDGKIIEDYSVTDVEIQRNIVDGEDELVVREGAKLTDEELRILADAIEKKRKINITQITSVKQKKKNDIQATEKENKDVKLIHSKMKFTSSAFLGLKSLTVKPFRLAFTIFLAVIAFGVFGIFDTVASFSQSKLILSALSKDYQSVEVTAKHLYNEEKGYSFQLSQDDIDAYSAETGMKFKGIYDVFDSYSSSSKNMNRGFIVTGLSSLSISGGSRYYEKVVNGIIEFAESEIDRENGIVSTDNFRYKLVYGDYPGKKVAGKNEVAISTYLAESIVKYAQAHTGYYQEKRVEKIQDLIGLTIQEASLETSKFTIIGIIDCGAIPEKYDVLKTDAETDDVALEDDFKSFINSAPYQSLFVGENFIREYRATENRPVYYLSMPGRLEINQTTGSELFYGSEVANKNNIIFMPNQLGDTVTERWTEDGKVILNDGETIIKLNEIEVWYKNEIDELHYNVRKIIRDKISQLKVSNDNMSSIQTKLVELFDVLKQHLEVDTLTKPLQLTKKLKDYETSYTKELKVVGFYMDINNDLYVEGGTFSPFIITTDDMSDLGIYNGQGIYSRMLAPIKSKIASRSLVKLMTKTDGIKLEWFENSVIDSVKANEKTVQKFFDLFLYISLVLALFSIFMLFNYITTSINSKRQTIGILRALGAGGKDIFTMFAVESVIIAFINGLFASIFTGVGSIIVNMYIRKIMNFSIDFAYFGIRQVLLIFLFSLVTAIISSLVPIIRISKEKPVDLIRKN